VRSPAAARAATFACAVLVAACSGHARAGATTATTTHPEDSAAPARAIPGADWPMFDFDPGRSGVGPATGISAGALGRLHAQVVTLDGTVDSAPIELHAVKARGATRDVIVVTTTYGRTIALDARSGRRLWQYTPATIGDYQGSYQVTTATPVADPDRRFVYATSPDGRIHKLGIASGHDVRTGGWPASVTRDPTKEKLAGALNVSGRWVIATTGGYYGDAPSYQGHVALIDRRSGAVAHVFNTLCSDRRRLIVPRSCSESAAGIWSRAGAVVEPGTGRLLVATGNGTFDGRTFWGDSVLELTPDAGKLLRNWTPGDQARLAATDTDVGSTAPALLPPFGGRRLAVQGAKDGKLRLLDLDRLNGGRGGASPRTGGELQSVDTPAGGEVLTAPAVWSHGGRTYVFVGDDSATAAYVLGGSPANPSLSVAWQHGTGATSPVIAGGLLYAFNPSGGELIVRDPRSGLKLASLPAASGHWNSPIVAGGRIVLPTGSYMDHAGSGRLYIWRLPGA
jgi:hypothetical protein